MQYLMREHGVDTRLFELQGSSVNEDDIRYIILIHRYDMLREKKNPERDILAVY